MGPVTFSSTMALGALPKGRRARRSRIHRQEARRNALRRARRLCQPQGSRSWQGGDARRGPPRLAGGLRAATSPTTRSCLPPGVGSVSGTLPGVDVVGKEQVRLGPVRPFHPGARRRIRRRSSRLRFQAPRIPPRPCLAAGEQLELRQGREIGFDQIIEDIRLARVIANRRHDQTRPLLARRGRTGTSPRVPTSSSSAWLRNQ